VDSINKEDDMKRTVKGLVLGAALAFAMPAYADGDSSSDSAGGFGQTLDAAEGVIVKVPINAQGEELTDAAEVVFHDGNDISTSGDFESAFAQGVNATNQANVSDADISRDSSTSGWYGRNSCGWQRNYYYSYQPTYYYYGRYVTYSVYSYRNYYNVGPYYGYRYYYHRRCW
jgi:hypothetical protein